MRKTTILKIKTQQTQIQQMGLIVTGLYNVANYERRYVWSITGHIPTYSQQYYSLRDHRLAKLLHSHVTQQVLRTLDQNYRSWFSLRKQGHPEANPPHFRKKGKPSTFHFTNYGFKILSDTEIQLSTKNLFGENLVINVQHHPQIKISELSHPKILQFVFKHGTVTAHLIYEINPLLKARNAHILAIDLGLKNWAVTYDTFQTMKLYKGGKILAIAYYFDKKIAQLQKKLSIMGKANPQRSSKRFRKLHHKKTAQIKQILHIYGNHLRDYCLTRDIRTVVIGDLTNIRHQKNFGEKTNLKLHTWRYAQFTEMLRYKLAEQGIRLEMVSEQDTSRTCPVCHDRRRSNRVTRGTYRCAHCGYRNQADVIGAMNILTRYQQGELTPSCNSHVSLGYVAKVSPETLVCTEAIVF